MQNWRMSTTVARSHPCEWPADFPSPSHRLSPTPTNRLGFLELGAAVLATDFSLVFYCLYQDHHFTWPHWLVLTNESKLCTVMGGKFERWHQQWFQGSSSSCRTHKKTAVCCKSSRLPKNFLATIVSTGQSWHLRLCSGHACSRCSAVILQVWHGHTSDWPIPNIVTSWLWPVRSLKIATCSDLDSRW